MILWFLFFFPSVVTLKFQIFLELLSASAFFCSCRCLALPDRLISPRCLPLLGLSFSQGLMEPQLPFRSVLRK